MSEQKPRPEQGYHELEISHKHGENYSVHASQADLKRTLYEYVCFYWGDLGTPPSDYPEEPPVFMDEAIEAYFDAREGVEGYTTGRCGIGGLPTPPIMAFALGFLASNLEDPEVEEALLEATGKENLDGLYDQLHDMQSEILED